MAPNFHQPPFGTTFGAWSFRALGLHFLMGEVADCINSSSTISTSTRWPSLSEDLWAEWPFLSGHYACQRGTFVISYPSPRLLVIPHGASAGVKPNVRVFTANAGKPEGVSNAGRSIRPKSSARANSMGSPDSAYADNNPPKYLITVSKNGAYSFFTE